MKYVATQVKRSYQLFIDYMNGYDSVVFKIRRNQFYRTCKPLKGYKYKWLVMKAFDSVEEIPTVENVQDYMRYIDRLKKKRKLKDEIALYK